MAMWRGSVVLVALSLGLLVRADEYGEAGADTNSVSDTKGAL